MKAIRCAILVLITLSMLVSAASAVVELPWNLQILPEQAFYQASNLTEAVLPDDLERIESQAFAQSGLKRITLPQKIDYIAPDAFDGCTNLVAECAEGSYAHQYCQANSIETAQPSLVIRVLLSAEADFTPNFQTALDTALDSAASALPNRLREHYAVANDADEQASQLADAACRGADVVLIDLADPADADDFAQTLSDAGIPFFFADTEPSAEVVKEHDSLFVGCSVNAHSAEGELAQACAAVAANYLGKGDWLDGLAYTSSDGWSLRLAPKGRLSGVVIGIDPGHQRKGNSAKEQVAPGSSEKKAKVSSGTSGVATGTAEYIRNLEISFKLRDSLQALGATVYMTRESHDVDISNIQRAQYMNAMGCDLVMRIHCNGSSNQKTNGIGLYVNPTNFYYPYYADVPGKSLRAAQYILPAMVAATGARSSGIFQRDSYSGLNWSTVPSILVETGYMTNPDEDRKLADPAYQQKLVNGMIAGICQYMGR